MGPFDFLPIFAPQKPSERKFSQLSVDGGLGALSEFESVLRIDHRDPQLGGLS